MKKRLLYISPHLDDAVLSCGGAIAYHQQVGNDVLVVTVFTGPRNSTIYQQRKIDDLNAVQFLGARAIHLDCIDAPFRNEKYRDFSTIMFHHTLPETEKATVAIVRNRLSKIITEFQPHEIYAPLGVGGHIDHHIVFESCKPWWSSAEQLFHCYNDVPYVLITNWEHVRWRLLKANPYEKGFSELPKTPSLLESDLPFVQRYIMSENDRIASETLFKFECDLMKTDFWVTDKWILEGILFNQCKIRVSEDCFLKKCKSVCSYTTEWPTLFGQNRDNIHKILSMNLCCNYYEEVVWSISKINEK
jgi:LmbE family N-acetylglucosaminyl deacetylase